MGFLKRKKQPVEPEPASPPTLARRKLNRESTMRSGRTIAERREKLETASERTSAHRKIKNRQILRILVTIGGFVAAAAILFFLGFFFFGEREPDQDYTPTVTVPLSPTIPVVDENSTGGRLGITSRMKEYIGQTEADFRELGLIPVKAVIPVGAIREVDFYLENHPGFIKLTIDRGSGVSVEDADRMLRYLASQGITEYEYIDVRIDGTAFWK